MSMHTPKILRCAIYTRKSSEEGLEQDFNSLHAQREACEAYVLSQRHEGWQLVPEVFDDGGCSGGTMDRPALKRLLTAIDTGRVDVVVVYKVDRLTRSLMDFAQIVARFDAQSVSFVSVTQSFNTTSSMGRLTLNVLLSFAQFEREVTGERIRDKIAASKKKGLWMGGYVPMGYAAEGRTLVPVEEDAKIIRQIFERFRLLKSIQLLQLELDRDGIVTRVYHAASQRISGNKPFSEGHLRTILTNPIYKGIIKHKGILYTGQHPALIEDALFEAVQQILFENGMTHRVKTNAKHANMLSGLLYTETGDRLVATHANKRGKRYRYYITKPSVKPLFRIAATELEALLIKGLSEHLSSPVWLTRLCNDGIAPDAITTRMEQARTIIAELAHTDPVRQRTQVHLVVQKLVLNESEINVELIPSALGVEQPIKLALPILSLNKGRQKHLLLENTALPETPLDKPLIKAIARAVTWYDDLISGRVKTLREIAEEENVSERYVSQLLRLAFLSPRLIEQILEGTIRLPISSATIAAGQRLPRAWKDQHAWAQQSMIAR